MNYYIAMDRYGNYDLAHHGILGMKWGIRRFQNKDGSLTEAGKKRLNKKYDANRNNYSKKDIKSWKRDDEGRIIREPDYYKWAEVKRLELKAQNNKKSVEQQEKELKQAYDAWGKDDFNDQGADEQAMLKLQRQIYDYSYGEPGLAAVSPNARKFEAKFDKWYSSTPLKRHSEGWRKEREKLRLEGCGVILKDLGYKDTERNRKYIYGLTYDIIGNLPIDDERK